MIDNFLEIQVKYSMETPILNPGFLGFAIRGILGETLKKISCTKRNLKDCSRCPLIDICAYGYFYERQRKILGKGSFQPVPKPYVIKNISLSEDQFSFSFRIFGEKPKKYFSIITKAFSEITQIGGRKRVNYGQIRLRKISSKINTIKPLRLKDRVKITFRTPTLLVKDKELLYEPDFYFLVTHIARRFFLLNSYYGSKIQFPNKILPILRDSVIVKKTIKWESFPRWSEKRKKKELVGGILGSITYEISENIQKSEIVSQLLAFGEAYGVGKRATAGLGDIKITTYSKS